MKEYLTYNDVAIKPKLSTVNSRSECKPVSELFGQKYDVPIISSPMETVTEYAMALELNNLGGIGAVHRFMSIEQQVEIASTLNYHASTSKQQVAIHSIGINGDYKERVAELYKNNVRWFLLDVANGWHINVKDAVNHFKSEYLDIKIIAGNICTAEAYTDFIDWGVDAARVGIGGGANCTTRIKTGVGLPNFTVTQEIVEVKLNSSKPIPIIIDGGIKETGDYAKALGAGADFVMLGSLLAATAETPNPIVKQGQWPNQQLYKKHYGSASMEAKVNQGKEAKNVEGASSFLPYKGHVERIIGDLQDGLKSSMSYVDARTLEEFHRNCEFVKITTNGQLEASPHGANLPY